MELCYFIVYVKNDPGASFFDSQDCGVFFDETSKGECIDHEKYAGTFYRDRGGNVIFCPYVMTSYGYVQRICKNANELEDYELGKEVLDGSGEQSPEDIGEFYDHVPQNEISFMLSIFSIDTDGSIEKAKQHVEQTLRDDYNIEADLEWIDLQKIPLSKWVDRLLSKFEPEPGSKHFSSSCKYVIK